MPFALATTALVLIVLLAQLLLPRLRRALTRLHVQATRDPAAPDCDPGRELRAEQRARRLLRSCVDPEDWAMYSELGFLRVWGAAGRGAAGRGAADRGGDGDRGAPHAYLIYPHLPIVAYEPQTGRLVGEHCIAFPNETENHGPPSRPTPSRLPDADDVLAKWLLLTASERAALAGANMHLPGRQIPAARLRRDLARLTRWEQERLARSLHGAARLSAS
jgi:hypothetical protein